MSRSCHLSVIQGTSSVKPSFATALLEEAPADEPMSPSEEREMSGAVEVVYSGETRADRLEP